jgi:hypothetical protein
MTVAMPTSALRRIPRAARTSVGPLARRPAASALSCTAVPPFDFRDPIPRDLGAFAVEVFHKRSSSLLRSISIGPPVPSSKALSTIHQPG